VLDGSGGAEEVQVVCGAPNARTGLVGVFAPVGTHIPGTGVDLKPGVIRGAGVERDDVFGARAGAVGRPRGDHRPARGCAAGVRDYIDYAGLNDPMIYIKVTPNRPDALGVRGIARDLAARGWAG
jgi:phenylalanyl-tRNA synthetase beta chain